jgi:WhiB family redox-sensing transcriptional regulator
MPIVAEREREHIAGGDWRHRAACLQEDPELFFPIGVSGPALIQAGQAKAVCAGCPVRETCLDWALETGQDSGVWGGMSEDERRALKRRQARAARRGRGAEG